MKIFDKFVALFACVCILTGISASVSNTYIYTKADTTSSITVCDEKGNNPVVKG